jgi:hypothetical protein
MATLYDIQPDFEPIEFTHFDTWFCDEKEDGTQEQYAALANEVLATWEQTLNIKLPRPNFAKDGLSLGFEVVCEAIVEAGYSVYNGDEFIEIYSVTDSKSQEYTVTKTIEYIYTVEASSYKEACEQVQEFGSIEADSWSTVSIEAESMSDYEESLK